MATIWKSKLPFELQGDARKKAKCGYESVIWEKYKKGMQSLVGTVTNTALLGLVNSSRGTVRRRRSNLLMMLGRWL